MSKDNDFGFSFIESNPQVMVNEYNYKERIQALQEKLVSLENIIIPLLENLKKNPEKSYIKWENRVPIIEEQIKRILSITRG